MLKPNSGFRKEFGKNKVLFLMLAPTVLYFIVFAYLPMAGLVVAFKSYNYSQGIFFSPWSGFENFGYFFKSGVAFQVTRNTIVFNLIFIVTSVIASVAIAVFLSEMKNKYFKKVSQSFLIFPYFISWVVVAAFVYNVFNYDYGVFNEVLRSLGFEPINIYSKTSYWYVLLPLLHIWKNVGYSSAIYFASIAGINTEYYEAARVDGANTFQRIRHITLPFLKPTVIVLVLLSVGQILRGNMDMFYQLIGNNGMLFNGTDVIDTYVFRSLTGGADLGLTSAATFYQSVMCFAVIYVTNLVVKKADKDYALF